MSKHAFFDDLFLIAELKSPYASTKVSLSDVGIKDLVSSGHVCASDKLLPHKQTTSSDHVCTVELASLKP